MCGWAMGEGKRMELRCETEVESCSVLNLIK